MFYKFLVNPENQLFALQHRLCSKLQTCVLPYTRQCGADKCQETTDDTNLHHTNELQEQNTCLRLLDSLRG